MNLQDMGDLKCLSKSPQDRYGTINSQDKALSQCECADAWDNDQAEQLV